MSQDMVSFVLRFVREAGEDQQARWRGIVKHVQGNGESNFTQFSEAVSFMQAHVNETVQSTFDEAEKLNETNPFLETARMWGEFMPRYTQMMMDSMGEAVNASGGRTMTKQMEQTMAAAMAAWGVPTSAQQERVEATLKSLNDQVDSLAAKVASLEARVVELKKSPPKRTGRKKTTAGSTDKSGE